MTKISVIGLGKLGASMAAVFAERGFDVIGVDINSASVAAVNDGKAPVQETGLGELIERNKSRIRAVSSHEEAILNTDISFVIVPTPSDSRGAFSLEYAVSAFTQIGKALARKTVYHNIVMTSTVLPGSMRQILLPLLERESGKKAGADFGLCYSPEFIALGSIIKDFLNPDFSLIGELDERSGQQLDEIYARVVVNGAKSARMILENAELTKISINSFVTTKITFANMLAEICENIPGGDVDVVSGALGLDQRIGRKYLTGAIAYGGPCFPRDNVALSFIANELGVRAELPLTIDAANRANAEMVVAKIRPLIRENATVAILGLAYKPFSHVTEESPALFIADKLSKTGVKIIAFDPLSEEMQFGKTEGKFELFDDLQKCLEQADAVLITTPDPIFAKLSAENFARRTEKVLVVDFWRILTDELQNQSNINYLAIGRGADSEFNRQRLRNVWTGEKENFQTSGK